MSRSSPNVRTIAGPETFLTSGFARWLGRHAPERSPRDAPLGVVLPRELDRFLTLVGDARVGDFVPRGRVASFASELAAARRTEAGRARLTALLAGAVPFGVTPGGDLFVYLLGDGASPARGVVALLDPAVAAAPRLVCRGMGPFAYLCTMHAYADSRVSSPGIAEDEAVRTAFERARAVTELLLGNDQEVRRAARKLALRPLDVPPPAGPARTRPAALALGGLVEAFFRGEPDADAMLSSHAASHDSIVASAMELLGAPARTASTRDLARRRALAIRAIHAATRRGPASEDRARLTRRIVEHIDATRPTGDPLAPSDQRAEALRALGELGDRAIVPKLVARALTGDLAAVEMLGALGDARAVPHLVTLIARTPRRDRQLEAVVVRAIGALGEKRAAGALRTLLAESPMQSWREGIERGALVKELVVTLGTLEDHAAAPALVDILEATSQEYRAILPGAAWALGRIRHLPALATLEAMLSSAKDPITPEAVWAVGEIGAARDPGPRLRATTLLENLKGLEPGAEMVRLTALAKVRSGDGPKTAEIRRALERALWEPAFRQDETSRRRMWALRSLEDLARLGRGKRRDAGALFLGHEAVRYFVTRDDHRVRRAAEDAFAAWRVPVPSTRRYYAFVLDDLEARGGVVALHEAVRDPLGIFRHNVATRLAERGQAASVRPLAEATARLFAEPPTSAYEYDDAPSHLVAFVRALAKLNRPEGNDVLIEGLRSGNHQVRAVVAENAPDDERFVPELMAMLGDPRSFLRSRAERSLATLGARSSSSDVPPRLGPV